MRGDFSRHTFDPNRHYAAVLQQQGRVQLDADWNEQQLLALHRDERTARDVVGPTGAPRVDPGFRVIPNGASLAISRGHFYVDGLLCVNERDNLPLTEQPDLPGFTLPGVDGVYLAFLEAWRRHESAAEQPDLREKALSGADTATRLRTVAQVRLLSLPNTGGNATCEGAIPEWNTHLAARAPAPSAAGRMSARTAPEGVTSDPACVLPPSAGFKGLENQLYRVEIHTGGTRATARFKWSRENGSVATPIIGVAGLELTVESTGRDDKLSFAQNQWVELTDDVLDLDAQRGALLQIDTVDPANRRIAVLGGPVPVQDATRHRVVRRWDQRNAEATADGVPLNLADWITLEDGIQVHFEAGTYKPGDFWLIPARSALTIETGSIEWPRDSAAQPLAVPSQGNDHHFARLGIFRRQGGNWTALSAETADCRTVFPPLTDIRAEDVSFDNTVCDFTPAARTVQAALDELCRTRHCQCTILITPGDDVAAAFARLGPDHDAMVCFQAGDYRVNETIVVAGRGHLRITGCGAATRLFSPRDECVLRFENCPSVTVEHVQIDGGASNRSDLNGALMFTGCGSVSVRQCTITTQGFGHRHTAGVTVRNVAANSAASVARIVGCTFLVGHLQIGVLLLNVGRSFVQDNVLRAGHRPASARLLENLDYRARVRRNLLSHAIFGSLPPNPPANINASITIFGHSVHFHTLPALTTANRNVNSWLAAMASGRASEFNGPHAVFRRLEELANRALLGLPQPNLTAVRTAAQNVLTQDTPAGQQGIVVAGTRADEVQVLNNTIENFIQGVHVGLSQRGPINAAPVSAGAVTIAQNTIRIRIATSATFERHGIFVGNFSSLMIAGNFVSATRSSLTTGLPTDGIRVYGYAGMKMAVRDNHLERFDVGVAFTTRVLTSPRLWVITQNLAANAAEGVRAMRRSGRTLSPIRPQIRGIDDNVPP